MPQDTNQPQDPPPACTVGKKKRVAWLDFMRVVAILCVISGHMGPPERCYPIIHWVLEAFGLPVCFFFFVSAMFLKSDTKVLLKRAALIYASYILWAVILFYTSPFVFELAAIIKVEPVAETSYSFAKLLHIIEPGITVRFAAGHLWFLRTLAILTLLSPLLFKISIRYLVVVFVALNVWHFALCMMPGFGGENDECLPFLLQKGAGVASSILFVAGVLACRMGGIQTITKLAALPAIVLFLIPVAVMLLAHFPTSHPLSPFLCESWIVSLMQTAAVVAFGLFVHRLSMGGGRAAACIKKGLSFVASMAPGVFFVYAIHFFHPVISASCYSLQGILPRVPYRILVTLSPVLVFIFCYLAYLPLCRIPYVSRLLCFVPSRRK